MEPAETALDRLAKELGTLLPTNKNNAEIHVNAGGVGVWVATTCCLVMFAVNVGLGMTILDQSRKIDNLNTYLTAIYMLAPHLKPKEE